MLTPEDQGRIREEEIYRAEVRRQLACERQGAFVRFLNTPLGLWLLSSVVVGLLSFAYTRWVQNWEADKQRQSEKAELTAEARFRLSEFGSTLKRAEKIGRTCREQMNTMGAIQPAASRKLLATARRIVALIRLGGLVSFAPPEDSRVRLGALRDLPQGRAYKNPKFMNYSLSDMVFAIQTLDGGGDEGSQREELDELLQQLEDTIEQIDFDTLIAWDHSPGTSVRRLGEPRASNDERQLAADDVTALIEWIQSVQKRWTPIMEHAFIEPIMH